MEQEHCGCESGWHNADMVLQNVHNFVAQLIIELLSVFLAVHRVKGRIAILHKGQLSRDLNGLVEVNKDSSKVH